jgi:hypothetical protein
MKNCVFWVVTPCGSCVALMKEAPGSSETSALTRATRRNNPEDTIHQFTRLHGVTARKPKVFLESKWFFP